MYTAKTMMKFFRAQHLLKQFTQGANNHEHLKLNSNSEPMNGGFLASES